MLVERHVCLLLMFHGPLREVENRIDNHAAPPENSHYVRHSSSRHGEQEQRQHDARLLFWKMCSTRKMRCHAFAFQSRCMRRVCFSGPLEPRGLLAPPRRTRGLSPETRGQGGTVG